MNAATRQRVPLTMGRTTFRFNLPGSWTLTERPVRTPPCQGAEIVIIQFMQSTIFHRSISVTSLASEVKINHILKTFQCYKEVGILKKAPVDLNAGLNFIMCVNNKSVSDTDTFTESTYVWL